MIIWIILDFRWWGLLSLKVYTGRCLKYGKEISLTRIVPIVHHHSVLNLSFLFTRFNARTLWRLSFLRCERKVCDGTVALFAFRVDIVMCLWGLGVPLITGFLIQLLVRIVDRVLHNPLHFWVIVKFVHSTVRTASFLEVGITNCRRESGAHCSLL